MDNQAGRRIFVTVTGRKISGLDDLVEQLRALDEVKHVEMGHHYEGLD